MERIELLNEIKGVFDSQFLDSGYVLVDIDVSRAGRRMNIRLAVDRKEGGITISECADINRCLSDVLDKENFIQESYILEVSSPGVDRPLVSEDDFRRNLHHNLCVFLKEGMAKNMQVEGELIEVNAYGIVIKTESGPVDIAFNKINKAKQIVK